MAENEKKQKKEQVQSSEFSEETNLSENAEVKDSSEEKEKKTASKAKKSSDSEPEKKPESKEGKKKEITRKSPVKAKKETSSFRDKKKPVKGSSSKHREEREDALEKSEYKEKKKPAKVAPVFEDIKELPAGAKESDTDFDWDAYSNSNDIYTSSDRDKFVSLYDKTLSTVAENEVVDGTVIAMNKREVVINIGYKSEGVVSLNEFRYNPDLKIGDKVEVLVESQEDKKGQLLLSHKKARALKSWDRVNESLEKDEIITGYIKCRTKGGMIVDVFGIEAFLPGSQIDVKPIRDYDIYVGKNMEFKVVKINQEFKNVVVSHKALIEAELEQQKKEIIAKLEKGQILEGTVKNITSYGVFIDLGGVDGLIHITDLSWGRINHPEEIVQLDQKLKW